MGNRISGCRSHSLHNSEGTDMDILTEAKRLIAIRDTGAYVSANELWPVIRGLVEELERVERDRGELYDDFRILRRKYNEA